MIKLIWRIRNPKEKRFTWRQKTPVMDYGLVSSVIPSLKSNHSTIVLSLNGAENGPRGPSYWKLNSSLLDDTECP